MLPFLLPAAGVGAPHRRDRIWFIAYSAGSVSYAYSYDAGGRGYGQTGCETYGMQSQKEKRERVRSVPERVGEKGIASLAGGEGFQIGIRSLIRENGIQDGTFSRRESARVYPETSWRQFPTQSGIYGGNDGVSNRVDRIKSLGNAIVPQVAYQIFKAMEAFEQLTP